MMPLFQRVFATGPVFATGIVARLRAVLAIILIVLLGVAVTSYFQIRNVNQAVEELTRNSIATFVHTEESERTLTSLLVLLQRADDADRAEDLGEIEREVWDRLGALRGHLRGLINSASAHDGALEYRDALSVIETNAQRIFALRRSILMHVRSLRASRADLERLRNEILTLLEDMSFQTAEATRQVFIGGRAATVENFDAFVQGYSQNLIVANTISSLLLEVEAIVEAAASLRFIRDAAELARVEDTLRFRMRNGVALLSQLPETEGRARLARSLIEIRQILFDSGAVQTVEDIQQETTLLTAVDLNQLAVIRNISEISQGLVSAARSEIETAETALSRASDRLALIWTVAAILSTLVILATLYFIVERQINRRVGKLTTAVLEISTGDVTHDVDVSGDDEFGKIAGALEIFKTNAQELSRSNQELEKFAYVAAHDLRSPLRAIQDLADWTIEDEESVLSEDAQENMALLQNRIARLSQLLSDLLQYSQVGAEGSGIAEVSLSKIVSETADMLDPDNKFGIDLTCTHDSVTTCATPLRQVLLNLINNAIKHHDRATGKISVDIHDDGDRMVCSVTDDGVGIPEEYHDRIFGLFQTLRPRDEVEGSGLGLAIVRKLLDRHGGGISVVSDPPTRRGTKFIFDLPSSPSEQADMDRAA